MSLLTSPRLSPLSARHNKGRYKTASRIAKETASISAALAEKTEIYDGSFNGNKFPGGVGGWIDQFQGLDYWTLRARSGALFETNMYARGIVRCMVKNIIATGLQLEAIPEEAILGYPEDSLSDWTETTENRFSLWGRTKEVCDYKQRRTFGEIQRYAYREALIGGDVLVIARQDTATGLPTIEVVPGERVRNPGVQYTVPSGIKLVDGVEVDSRGRHVAFWVDRGISVDMQERYIRISARGELTNRLQAWLVYGVDKREDGVRGEPLLAIAIQPLLEIDRYRDSAQRKAAINAMIVGFIENNGSPSSLPIQGGAAKKASVTTNTDTGAKAVTVAEVMPGLFMDRLNPGEKPSSYAVSGSDVNFGPFEAAIIHGLAWGLGLPPENLTLEFQSNYSASQAANSEFSVFIDNERDRFGSDFCDPCYADWFLSSLLLGKIEARGFLDAIGNPKSTDIVQAWLSADWTGAIKPSIDIVKQATGYNLQISMGACTRDRATRNINGTKFSKNVRRLAKENQQLMEAMRPVFDAKKEYGEAVVDQAMTEAVAYLRSVKDDDDDEMATPAN